MKDGVMINAQAYHDTSLSNLLLTEKCSTGLSVNYKLKVIGERLHDNFLSTGYVFLSIVS